MNKNLLIKYIRGFCDDNETNQVQEWIERSEDNARYFSRLMNMWVSQNMPQDEASDGELAEIMGEIDRRYSRPPVKKGLYISHTAAWTGAACLIAIIGAAIWTVLPDAPEVTSTFYSPGKYETWRTFYTDMGVKGSIVLPDSSVVWLNSGSTLRYPDGFGDAGVREVMLSGEGYFEVKPDPRRPMVVNTSKNFRVEVLGTAFNLKSYDNDDAAVATLYSGRIDIVMDDGIRESSLVRMQRPNEIVTIHGDNTSSSGHMDVPGKCPGWKEGRINFDATPVSEAVKILERWHGVKFVVNNSEVLDYCITADFGSESIVQIMDLIRITSFIDYRIVGKNIFLEKR